MTTHDFGPPAIAVGADTARYRMGADEQPSDGVFAALRSASDDALDPTRPLAECIDLDALDDLFARADRTPLGHVEFVYGEFRVRITADRTVVAWRRMVGADGG